MPEHGSSALLLAGKACGVGPGLVFAASLLRARKYKVKPTGPQIGLVPCAIGGTSIVQWEKGRVLYNHMIQRTKAALEKGGTLKALLWYQGESDAVEKSLADHYEQRLVTFFNHVRTDLNNHNLPIIQVSGIPIIRMAFQQIYCLLSMNSNV